MSQNPFHSQIEQNIQKLLVEKKFKQAYQMCSELISKFPEEASYVQLLQRIEKEVEKENRGKIKQKLKELDPLWKEEKYGEIIRELQKILAIYPNHIETANLYEKAQKLYAQYVRKQQDSFEKEQRIRLGEMLKSNPDMLIMELLELERNNAGNSQVQALIHEYRTAVIKKKIEEKRDLINSGKQPDLNNFINQLNKIEDGNIETKKVLDQIEKSLAQKQFESEKEYLYENKQHINNLLKLKKYDKALQAIRELLDKYPKDTELRSMLNSTKKKSFRQTKLLAVKAIEEKQKSFREEYKNNKADFIHKLGL